MGSTLAPWVLRKPGPSMIRQAHTYLAGALSGAALIAAAVVVFVALVSVQAVRDWPLSGLVSGYDPGSVSAAHPAAKVTGARAGARAGAHGGAGSTIANAPGSGGSGGNGGGEGSPSAGT